MTKDSLALHRRSVLAAGFGVLSGLWTGPSQAQPTPRRAGLVLMTGNSHSIGWAPALPSDRFSDRVMEYTQDGRLLPVAGTVLDAGDANPVFGRASIGPSLSFLNALAGERDDLDVIVAVATGKGSTGFTDGVWSARPPLRAGNLLARAIERWNAARQALIRQSFEVVPLCAVHLSARPDADISAPERTTERADAYAADIDAYVDRVRADLQGADSLLPVLASCTITQKQMQILGSDLVSFASAGNGIAWRRPFTWFVDPVNDWADGERDHLPVVPFDGAHADRDGALTEGRLLHAALGKALRNPAPHAPFSTLDSEAALQSLYDFRSGCGRDMTGRAHLLQALGAPAIIRYAPAFRSFAFAGLGGDDRNFLRRHPLPSACTIALRLAFAAAPAGQTLLAGADADTSERFRLFIDGRSRLALRWAATSIATAPVPREPGRILSVALCRDGDRLQLFLNGRPARAASGGGGGDIASLTLGSDFAGEMQSCAIFDRALTAAQIAALASASYDRP